MVGNLIRVFDSRIAAATSHSVGARSSQLFRGAGASLPTALWRLTPTPFSWSMLRRSMIASSLAKSKPQARAKTTKWKPNLAVTLSQVVQFVALRALAFSLARGLCALVTYLDGKNVVTEPILSRESRVEHRGVRDHAHSLSRLEKCTLGLSGHSDLR